MAYQALPGMPQVQDTYRIMQISGSISSTGRNTPGPASNPATGRYSQYLLNYINNPCAINPASTRSAQGIATTGQYNPGHLIAATLGGPNSTLNLVPMSAATNLSGGGYNAMENWIRNVLQEKLLPGPGQAKSAPTTATMTVNLSYSNSASSILSRFIPTNFNVTVTFDSKTWTFSFTQTSLGANFTAPEYWEQ